MAQSLPPIAVTLGDPAGVGPLILARATMRMTDEQIGRMVVVGHKHFVARFSPSAASRLHFVTPQVEAPCLATPQSCAASDTASDTAEKDLSVADADADADAAPLRMGEDSAQGGAHAFHAIRTAVSMANRNEVAAIVTLPISKRAMHMAGHFYDGHTEILHKYAAERSTRQPVMLLTNALAPAPLSSSPSASMPLSVPSSASASMPLSVPLSAAHVTTHLALSEVEKHITEERITEVILAVADHWEQIHNRAPRLAVAGLNPHAGEGGLFGSIEQDLLAPVVASLQKAMPELSLSGPHAPDTVFHRAAQGVFDCVIAMYHDQAHIPIKLVAFHEAVNVTLGNSVKRCSVDHGVAYDLARPWQGWLDAQESSRGRNAVRQDVQTLTEQECRAERVTWPDDRNFLAAWHYAEALAT
ncbi:MAG: 4-hydroxythreonine-4-phosphate dehydrogenase PdxA [Alphaproteobacteria bacterium]|nr:4-hydroxythreonine-4-phosphate dehydrogenase PdxA [Alphaproteobacteria bacterium]